MILLNERESLMIYYLEVLEQVKLLIQSALTSFTQIIFNQLTYFINSEEYQQVF